MTTQPLTDEQLAAIQAYHECAATPTYAEREVLLAEMDWLRALVRDLADPDPCDHFDHHGYCQTHGWFATEPPCPHGRAQSAGLVHDDTDEES